MSATAAARSIVRSANPRAVANLPSAAPKPRGCPKSTFSPFRSSKQTPVSLRISRSPVELSCSLETLLPYHTATASSLLTSKLSLSRIGYSWTLEGQSKPR